MIALVTGSRNWTDKYIIQDALIQHKPTLVIEGGALGADNLASIIAQGMGIHTCRVMALWDTHGKAAGPMRNEAMLELNPRIVLAFPMPGSKGTWDMVEKARKKNILVIVYYTNGDEIVHLPENDSHWRK